MSTEFEIKAIWFQRLPEEMPAWKRLVWRVFGKRLEGVADGYKVVAYKFKDITLIHSVEFAPKWEKKFDE